MEGIEGTVDWPVLLLVLKVPLVVSEKIHEFKKTIKTSKQNNFSLGQKYPTLGEINACIKKQI